MRVALISPALVVQRADPFTTGIVYMPVGLASVAAAARHDGLDVTVIDAFGEATTSVRGDGAFWIFGLTPDTVAERVPAGTTLAVVYANAVANHLSVLELVRAVRRQHPQMPIAVLENTQAVTAYALSEVSGEMYSAGASFVISGEGERRVPQLARAVDRGDTLELLAAIDGLGWPEHTPTPPAPIADLDALPLPAWDLFPLQGYWSVGHAHGPLTGDRYLPLLTSRGCPYPCRFCVVPATNRLAWRARSAASVVDEMAAHAQAYGVTEFHVEDLDPTINDTRTRAIAEEILRRGLRVSWKIASGTKVESIRDEETVALMARAGCTYISISPETGSPEVLRAMRKPFDRDHAERIVRAMSAHGIRSQACFVLGFPGETDTNRAATRQLVRALVSAGVDEIALFIITPVPGSAIFSELGGYGRLSDLTFSPTWRADFAELNRFRLSLYRQFLWWKLCRRPGAVMRQCLNFARRRFETKMEMAPWRAVTTMWRGRHAR